MRLLEIVLIAYLVVNLIRILFARSRGFTSQVLIWIGLFILMLHWVTEGARWQMYPTYLLVFIVIVSYYTVEAKGTVEQMDIRVRASLTLLLMALFAVAVSLPILLPVPQLQEPTGDFTVGTKTFHLIDAERNDPYAPDPSMQRELMLQIWYPADPESTDKKAPWMDSAEIVAPEIAGWLELPGFFLDHLHLTRSKALMNAEPLHSEAPYPMLLFSHGYGGFRAQNTNQAQELASHGFVVIGVEHTYGAVVTVFPDRRIARHNPDTLPDGLPEDESLKTTRALGRQWVQDLQFVLDSASGLTKNSLHDFLAGIIDTDWIGIYGHSTGGGAAIEFCALDTRCDAVLTMDPFMKPVPAKTLAAGISAPALHLFSEEWPSDENTARFLPFFSASTGAKQSLSIEGTAHYDFSDLPLLTPIAHTIGLKGPLSGKRVIQIVNTLSVSFFEQTLRPDGASAFSISLESYPELNRFP